MTSDLHENIRVFLAEAEAKALDYVRNQLNQLPIVDWSSPANFDSLFLNAVESMKQQILIAKYAKVVPELKDELYEMIDTSVEQLHAKLKEENQDKLLKILDENKELLGDCESLYSSKLDLFFDEDLEYVPPSRLEKFHKTCLAAAHKYLFGKLVASRKEEGLREVLQTQLDSLIDVEYKKVQQTNEEASTGSLNALQVKVEQIIVCCREELRKLVAYSDTSEAILREVHAQAVTSIRDEMLKSEMSNKEELKVKCFTELQHILENAIEAFMDKLQGQVKAEDTILNDCLQFFVQRVGSSDCSLDEEKFVKLLKFEEETVVNRCRAELGRLGSENISHRVADLTERVQMKIEELFANNVTSNRVNLSPQSSSKLPEVLGNSDHSSECTLGQHNGSGLEQLLPVKALEVISGPSHCVPEFPNRDADANGGQTVLSEAEAVDVHEKDVEINWENDAMNYFSENIHSFLEEFDVINHADFVQKSKHIQDSLISRLQDQLILAGNDPIVSENLLQRVQDTVQNTSNNLWSTDVSQKNKMGENKICKRISYHKKTFETFALSASIQEIEETLTSHVHEFSKELKFSSEVDRDKFVKKLEETLFSILDVVKQKAEREERLQRHTTEILEEFERKAEHEDFFSKLVDDFMEKFKEAAKPTRTEANEFKQKLMATVENIRKIRENRRKNLFELKELSEMLVRKFKTELKTSGSGNGAASKRAAIEELERKALACKIEGKDFVEKLTNELDSAYTEHEYKLQKEADALIQDVLSKYRECMDMNFEDPIYFTSKTLGEFHAQAVRDAIANCPKARKNEDIKRKLQKGLDEAFEEFRDKNAMNTPTSFAIGIDLGTTYSCVGVYVNGRVEIIPNDLGKKTTPSFVHFADGGKVTVGEAAKNQSHMYPESTIYEVKRLIGRKMEDESIQKDKENWPFKVVNEKGIPKVQVGDQTYFPEEVSAHVLKKLKQCAENYLKQEVKYAVITVPAYFNEGQKTATKNAGEAAGLEVLKIITEPTAAAIAYNLNWKESRNSLTGLVYDLGGGTFDVAVFTASLGNIDIKNVGGDTHLGGVDFDNEMVNYCLNEFEKSTGMNIHDCKDSKDIKKVRDYKRKLMRLKKKCEAYKIDLTEAKQVTVSIDMFHENEDLNVRVSREQFEEVIDKYITDSLAKVEEVLRDTLMDKEDVHEVVLIGGSTRIPKIQEKLMSYFGKPLQKRVNPDEAVAVGAAYEAAVLNGKRAQDAGDILSATVAPKGMAIRDIVPMSYGVEIAGGEMHVLIPKRTHIPTEVSRIFHTAYHQQTSVLIVIYEGEHPMATNNTKVGEFFVNGIPPGLAGRQEVLVMMKVDNNGSVHVSATSVQNGVSRSLTVRVNRRAMTRQDIHQRIGRIA